MRKTNGLHKVRRVNFHFIRHNSRFTNCFIFLNKNLIYNENVKF